MDAYLVRLAHSSYSSAKYKMSYTHPRQSFLAKESTCVIFCCKIPQKNPARKSEVFKTVYLLGKLFQLNCFNIFYLLSQSV